MASLNRNATGETQMYDESKITKTPSVGLPATYRIGSDRYAGVITAVSRTGHKFTWTRVNDSTGELVPGFTHEATRRSNGEYLAKGSNYGSFVLGIGRTDLDQGF
jgi:hypothetical protein